MKGSGKFTGDEAWRHSRGEREDLICYFFCWPLIFLYNSDENGGYNTT